jgi:cytochrome c oxidase subunit 2
MLEWLVVPASTFAGDIDFVFALVGGLVGFWYILTNVAFVWFLFRYRKRPGVPAQYITGTEHHLKRWVEWPHYLIILCDFVVIFAAVQVWYKVKQDLPPAEAEVRVMSQQWAWSFVHPGVDGKLDTADDIKTVDELHVEVDKLYHFKLESRDVLHSFSVPSFRLKQDAVPGRVITGWFEPNRVGSFDIQCAEICGIGHGIMPARIIVHTPEEYAAWQAGASPTI